MVTRRRIVQPKGAPAADRAKPVDPPKLLLERHVHTDPQGRTVAIEVVRHDDGEVVARVRSRGGPLSPAIVIRADAIDSLLAALAEARTVVDAR